MSKKSFKDAAKEVVKEGAKGAAKAMLLKGIAMLNHPQWYTRVSHKGLLGLNLAHPNGYPLEWILGYDAGFQSAEPISLPNVFSIELNLTIPGNKIGSSGGSYVHTAYWRAIDRLTTSMKAAATSTADYEAKDVSAYILNQRSIVAAFAYICRAYKLLFAADSDDMAVPIQYFCHMGLDYDDFKDNAPSIRTWLENAAIEIATKWPMRMPTHERTEWLFFNLFADSKSAKDNTILFTTSRIPYLTRTDPNTNTANTARTISISDIDNKLDRTGLKWEDVRKNIDRLMTESKFINKFSKITADIWRAYGKEATVDYGPTVFDLFKIADNSDYKRANYKIVDNYIKDQICNATVVGRGSIYDWAIDPQFGPVQQGIKFTTNTISETVGAQVSLVGLKATPMGQGKVLINARENKLDPGRIMSITRLATSIQVTQTGAGVGSTYIAELQVWGTEVASFMRATFVGVPGSVLPILDFTPKHNIYMVRWENFSAYNFNTATGIAGTLNELFVRNIASGSLSCNPFMATYLDIAGDNSTFPVSVGFSWDVANWALVDKGTMGTYQDYATQSLFFAPVKVPKESGRMDDLQSSVANPKT